MSTTYALDATHDNVGHVPLHTPYVIGYDSGTPDIEWTAQDWGRLAGSYVIHNYQGYGYPRDVTDALVDQTHEIDVENGALTPAEAAHFISLRVSRGWQWTGVYGSDATLALVAAATEALGAGIWIGHVVCRLANWNLNYSEAAALIGQQIHGITCVGVQYASPTSNPHTLIPGTATDLETAQVDMSVVNTDWINYVTQRVTAPAPPAPPAPRRAIVVELPNGPSLPADSTDNGKTWTIS